MASNPIRRAPKKSTPPKKKMGRPPLPEARVGRIVRLLDEEVAAFERMGAKSGIGWSTWLRTIGRREAGLEDD